MSTRRLVGGTLPILITFILGVLTVSDYFIKETVLQSVSSTLQNWAVVIAGFAVGIGIIHLLTLQVRCVRKREKQWPYSAVLAGSLILSALWGIAFTVDNPVYQFFYFNLTLPLQVTIFALLVFFLASAAFRAMRLRSVDAGIMLVAAILVMLMNAPVGAVIWNQFPVIGSWVMDIPNVAGQRAMIIGIALGVIAIGTRMFLGYERSYIGRDTS